MKEKSRGYVYALKGLAILGVTMVHSGGHNLPGILGMIGTEGARGAQLFFVLSGIHAFQSLSNYLDDKKITFKGILGWYYRKLVRLAPLYYVAVVISMVTKSWSVYWLGNEGRVTAGNIVAHILFLHGLFPHYSDSILAVEWYLGVLWIFLLITPLLFYLINSLERSILFFIVVYTINPLIKLTIVKLLPMDTDPPIYSAFINVFCPNNQLLVYSLGIVAYFAIGRLKNREIKNRKLLSGALLFFGLTLIYGQITGVNSLFCFSHQEMFGLFFFVIVISQAIYAFKIIDNPIFRTLGKYSYGMFLFQFIWLNFYDSKIHYRGPFAWTIKYIISVIVLLTTSIVTHRLVERPAYKVLKAERYSE